MEQQRTPITLQECKKRIKFIRSLYSTDPESGHSEEDGLTHDILRAVIDSNPDAIAMARLALNLAKDSSLSRYYA